MVRSLKQATQLMLKTLCSHNIKLIKIVHTKVEFYHVKQSTVLSSISG